MGEKITVLTNTGGGSSGPLKNKVYEKIGDTKITLGQKIEDLKNWYYEDGQVGLFKVPKWSEIDLSNFDLDVSDSIEIYYDELNNVELLLYYMGENEYNLIVEIDRDAYSISNFSSVQYDFDANVWIEEMTRNRLDNPPQVELDPSYITDEAYTDIFNAIYGLTKLSLKDKFESIENMIEEQSNIPLNNKIYENVTLTDLEDGKTYKIKNSFGEVFEKGYETQDIYTTDDGPDVKPSFAKGEAKGGSRDIEEIEGEEKIITISYQQDSPSDYISIVTNYGEYRMDAIIGQWIKDGQPALEIPSLEYYEEYVVNKEILLQILDTYPQTLKEKLDTPLEKWNYKNNNDEHKLLYDVSKVINFEYYKLLGNNNLLPSRNSNVNVGKLYEDIDLRLDYTATWQNGDTILTFNWKRIHPDEEASQYTPQCICQATISNGNVTYYWVAMFNGVEHPLTSQDELIPTNAFNSELVAYGYDANIVAPLIANLKKSTTLKEKIEDVQNWAYETKEEEYTDETSYQLPSKYNEAFFEKFESLFKKQTTIYGGQNEDYEIYFRTVNGDKRIGVFMYDLGNNLINIEYSKEYEAWIEMDGYDLGQDTTAPTILFNSSLVVKEEAADYVFGFKEITTIKEKFQTCLVLERLSNVTILENELESNNNSYASSPYLYVWKAEIQDEAFIDALKVEVLFDIEQITSENFCPLQDIDTENGVLTLYVKQKSGNIVLNRIDIFKNSK